LKIVDKIQVSELILIIAANQLILIYAIDHSRKIYQITTIKSRKLGAIVISLKLDREILI